jgi:hypothetical protein
VLGFSLQTRTGTQPCLRCQLWQLASNHKESFRSSSSSVRVCKIVLQPKCTYLAENPSETPRTSQVASAQTFKYIEIDLACFFLPPRLACSSLFRTDRELANIMGAKRWTPICFHALLFNRTEQTESLQPGSSTSFSMLYLTIYIRFFSLETSFILRTLSTLECTNLFCWLAMRVVRVSRTVDRAFCFCV